MHKSVKTRAIAFVAACLPMAAYADVVDFVTQGFVKSSALNNLFSVSPSEQSPATMIAADQSWP